MIREPSQEVMGEIEIMHLLSLMTYVTKGINFL